MDSLDRIGTSNRETDRLAYRIFCLLKDRPAEDKQLVLNVLRSSPKVDSGRALLIDAAIRRFDEENSGRLSKRRYEAWRVGTGDKSLPSASFITRTYGGTWSKAMDALGRQPSLEHASFRLRAAGTSPEPEDVLQDLKDCAAEIGQENMTFRQYRDWARATQPHAPLGKNYLLSSNSFKTRFGSFNRALKLAGIKPVTQKLGPWGGCGRYDQKMAIDSLRPASDEVSPGEAITQEAYSQWRRDEYAALDGTNWEPEIPSMLTVRALFGSWPSALVAAGLISEARGNDYAWGQGQRMTSTRIAEDCLRAFELLNPSFTMARYDAWRAKEAKDMSKPRPPSASLISKTFGGWKKARSIIDLAASCSDPQKVLVRAIDPGGSDGQ